MNKLFTLAATLLLGSAVSYAGEYKVTANLTDEANGSWAIITNFDNGDKIDSVLVENSVAVFNGSIDTPIVARMSVGGERFSQFFIEEGTISINAEGNAIGSHLNDIWADFQGQVKVIYEDYQAAPTDSAKTEMFIRYEALLNKTRLENADNAVGFLLFVQNAYELTADEINAYIAEHPAFASSQRLANVLNSIKAKESTSEGCQYIDFEVEGKRLSDYVGKGKYVLVDFFASWCGPCMRQVRVLKEVYNEYKDSDKLTILGVAVWDEPADTERAIAKEEIPWECIINAQSLPTDLYGIVGIPCIILISPDGTILSRDKQSEELVADIHEYVK